MELLKVYKLTSISTIDEGIELVSFSSFINSKYNSYCYYIRFYYYPSELTDPSISLHICHNTVGSTWRIDNIDNIFRLK